MDLYGRAEEEEEEEEAPWCCWYWDRDCGIGGWGE